MLDIKDLTKVYGHFTALDKLSLQIGDGELPGFVGPNGAGKTTTMRILATLLLPTSGTAAIDGADVVKEPKKVRRLVGYMPDFFGVYDHLKSWEYLDFYARCYGFSHAQRMRMIDQLLELVNLQDKRDVYVDSLSRGRMIFAVVTVTNIGASTVRDLPSTISSLRAGRSRTTASIPRPPAILLALSIRM